MNPLNREWFYRGFRKKLRIVLPMEKAEEIWESAGKEYASILQKRPGLKQHKGAMVIPWIYKMAFKSERQHPVKCEADRRALRIELLVWINKVWD